MRLGIVNDLNLALEALRQVVARQPELDVAWTAANGEEAVRMCAQDPPDLVLMDLVMPVMDGVEATRRIMLNQPMPILIVTATIEGHGAMVYEALGYGALDAAVTPRLGLKGDMQGAQPLLDKIAEIAVVANLPLAQTMHSPAPELPSYRIEDSEQHCPLVAIGASTGGPNALVELFAALPADFPAAIAVVQHLDCHFMEGLRDWLAARSAMPVQLAPQVLSPRRGHIYLPAENAHWVAEPKGHLVYTTHPENSIHRPSVDVFFKSLAQSWQTPGIAMLLTGMGSDGAEGMLELKNKGWKTCAQDARSSVVYGMPKAAVKLQAATEQKDLAGLAQVLNHHAWPIC